MLEDKQEYRGTAGDNIKVNLKEIWENMNWVHLAQDRESNNKFLFP
jgi:hypothetical protein